MLRNFFVTVNTSSLDMICHMSHRVVFARNLKNTYSSSIVCRWMDDTCHLGSTFAAKVEPEEIPAANWLLGR